MVMDEKGKVIGILSERDYARKVILKGKTSRETLVEEIMTPYEKMYTVKPDTSVRGLHGCYYGQKSKAPSCF